MTVTENAPTTRHRVRPAVFLPAVGLVAAAAAQVDAAVITNAFRSASPAPQDSLNFPWYGDVAGQVSTWWSFTGLFLAIGFVALARSEVLRGHRAGRIGAWAAVVAAGLIVVANFLSAANGDAMMTDGISKVIVGMFAAGTLLIAGGLTTAGIAIVRFGSWRGITRFIPLANGVWPFLMIALLSTPLLQVAIGIMAALQMALGAALITEEA